MSKAALCPNGFGDRMIALVAYYTWHKMKYSGTLNIFWPQNERKGNAFAPVNEFQSIKSYFELPDDICIFTDRKSFDILQLDDLTQPNPQTLWPPRLSIAMQTDIDSVRKHMRKNFHIIKPSHAIAKTLSHIPCPCIGVHIRRGDKVQCERNQSISIKQNELKNLDAITHACISKFCTTDAILVCSDDHRAAQAYVTKYASRCVAIPVSQRPFENTFIDFFALQKSSTVIISQKYSTFSIVAALSGDARCILTMHDKRFLAELGLLEWVELY